MATANDEILKNQAEAKKNRRTIIWAIVIIAIAWAWSGWYVYYRTVYIDLSQVQAPTISLSPTTAGLLQAMFVNVGDTVTTNQAVAQVGDEIVKAQTNGIIVSNDENIGQYENAGQGVVATMIDPTQLRVVGLIDEDKGLSRIHVGDIAKFTVDAFGSKAYYGVVDEIGEVSAESVTSNVFDQRQTNRFDVYVRFNPARYPELKDGMSARIWVYPNY